MQDKIDTMFVKEKIFRIFWQKPATTWPPYKPFRVPWHLNIRLKIYIFESFPTWKIIIFWYTFQLLCN